MHKVLHITDVHFGRDHLHDRSRDIVRLSAERRPDVVVFSGDLTQRAKPKQFAEARAFVDALGAPAVVIPGNHDVPLFRVWERVFAPYGAYRKHFGPELEPEWEDEELLVVGLNTAHGWTFTGGRLWRRRIARLAERLERRGEGRFTIVALHHQIIPVPGYGRPEVFRNARLTARALAAAHVDLVLAGHVHLSYLGDSTAIDPLAVPAVPILFSGTASCSRGRGPEKGRNSCHWLEIAERELTIERLEWQGEPDGFVSAETRVLPRRRGDG